MCPGFTTLDPQPSPASANTAVSVVLAHAIRTPTPSPALAATSATASIATLALAHACVVCFKTLLAFPFTAATMSASLNNLENPIAARFAVLASASRVMIPNVVAHSAKASSLAFPNASHASTHQFRTLTDSLDDANPTAPRTTSATTVSSPPEAASAFAFADDPAFPIPAFVAAFPSSKTSPNAINASSSPSASIAARNASPHVTYVPVTSLERAPIRTESSSSTDVFVGAFPPRRVGILTRLSPHGCAR